LLLILGGFGVMVVGRILLREVLLPLSAMSILTASVIWTIGQLLCFAAPARHGARWFNLACVLVQWGSGPLQFFIANPVIRSVTMVVLGIIILATMAIVLRQLALDFRQPKLASRASITLLAGAIVVISGGGYVAIRSADITLLPAVGPIVLLLVSLIWLAALAKLVRSLRIETRRIYRSRLLL
jgi:hypothetical protein